MERRKLKNKVFKPTWITPPVFSFPMSLDAESFVCSECGEEDPVCSKCGEELIEGTAYCFDSEKYEDLEHLCEKCYKKRLLK